MKLGIAYNFFDGEELLKKSMVSVLNHVGYICIVYQKISNYCNEWNPENQSLLNSLNVELIEYVPDLSKAPNENEINKRNIGLQKCRENSCSHILMMDADEFYISQDFEGAKNFLEENNHDSSACQMFTYFKKPIYQIIPPEKYFVPFIHKINDSSEYVLHHHYPVLVDQTRILNQPQESFYKFPRNQLAMHHFSFVRKNIKSKIMNSSAKVNFKDPEKYINFFNNWKPGIKNFHPSNSKEFKDIKVVENIFSIEI